MDEDKNLWYIKKMDAVILTFGNEKGGSGKSTTAIQVAIGLLRLGYRVGSLDLDARQGTMTRFFANRFSTIQQQRIPLPSPTHFPLEPQAGDTTQDIEKKEPDFFLSALHEMKPHHDFIVIDTAGAHTFLGQLAHAHADIVITPLNDSAVDLDVIARRVAGDVDFIESVYTTMIKASQRDAKSMRNITPRWIVLRNRLVKNQDQLGNDLKNLAEKFHFELIHGIHENVKFRDLFSQGLSILDPLPTTELSDITARQDVRQLLRALDPVKLKGYRRKL